MKDDELLKRLGLNIREKRNQLGISQEQLAFQCGFDRTYISLIERGKRNPSFINLLKLSRGLNIKIEDIVMNMEYK